MTVSEYVARDINVIPPLGLGDTVGSTVGIPNPLDVADGSTGYVEQERTSNAVPPDVAEVTTFTIERAAGSPAPAGTITDLWYEVEYEVSGTFLPGFIIAARTPAGTALTGNGSNRPTTWTRYTLSGNLNDAELQAVLDPATYFEINDAGGQTFLTTGYIRVTYLRVFIESGGAIPLRLRQRGDGLGMGGPRVRGVGSRQGSPRVRGYV